MSYEQEKATIGYEAVKARLDATSPGTAVVFLVGAAESAWDPSSTKRVITGPCTVSYTRYSDGGVHAVRR